MGFLKDGRLIPAVPFGVLLMVVAAGCLGPASGEPGTRVMTSTSPDKEPSCPDLVTCAPPPAAAPNQRYTLHVSNCTTLAHTLYAPTPVFAPTYPTGTRAANPAITFVFLDNLLCDQATDGVSTVSPFYATVFGASIGSPGPSAENATQSFAGFDAVTNHQGLAHVLREAGWLVTESEGFAFEWTIPPDGRAVTPYSLRVPANGPQFVFEGSRSAEPDGGLYHSIENYYTEGNATPHVLRWNVEGLWVGSGQPAVTTFAPSTYWAVQGAPSKWEAGNFVRIQAGGNIVVERISTL